MKNNKKIIHLALAAVTFSLAATQTTFATTLIPEKEAKYIPIVSKFLDAGNDTIALYRVIDSNFHIKGAGANGVDLTFRFGDPCKPLTCIPIAGVWRKSQLKATVGLYNPNNNTFYLSALSDPEGKNTITSSFGFGFCNNECYPVVGDFDGDGVDTIGLFNHTNATFALKNSNPIGSAGFADITISYGNPGDIPIVGDWNNDKFSTLGVYRPSESRFYLNNTKLTSKTKKDDLKNNMIPSILYGDPCKTSDCFTSIPIAGKWSLNQKGDAIGLYMPNTSAFHLRNSTNATGVTTSEIFGDQSSKTKLTINQDDMPAFDTPFMVPSLKTWKVTGGTHQDNGRTGTLSSLDFTPFTGQSNDVFAAADGTVITDSDYLKSVWKCGNPKHVSFGLIEAIILDHGLGWQTLYGHINPTVINGQEVKKGDKIGQIQATCITSNPHLHFTVFKNNALIDLTGTTLSGWKITSQADYAISLSKDTRSSCYLNTFASGIKDFLEITQDKCTEYGH